MGKGPSAAPTQAKVLEVSSIQQRLRQIGLVVCFSTSWLQLRIGTLVKLSAAEVCATCWTPECAVVYGLRHSFSVVGVRSFCLRSRLPVVSMHCNSQRSTPDTTQFLLPPGRLSIERIFVLLLTGHL